MIGKVEEKEERRGKEKREEKEREEEEEERGRKGGGKGRGKEKERDGAEQKDHPQTQVHVAQVPVFEGVDHRRAHDQGQAGPHREYGRDSKYQQPAGDQKSTAHSKETA